MPKPITKSKHLTPRLKRALLALHRHIEQHGAGPTAAELAVALDQSKGAAIKALAELLERGYTRRSAAWRDIQLTTKGNKAVEA